jgi:hypothetical protein
MDDSRMAALRLELTNDLRKAITENRIAVDDAITLVAHGMQLMDRIESMSGAEKSRNLRIILEDIAKGPDGEWGTEDDLLSPIVWSGVKTLIDGGVLQAVMNVIFKIQKGTFPSIGDPEVQVIATGCFGLIMDTIRSPRSPRSPRQANTFGDQ